MNFIKKISLLTILFGLFICNKNLVAQQLPYFIKNQDSYNPSFISNEYFKLSLPSHIGVQYRYQWVDIEDAPRTLVANFSHFSEDYNFSFGGNLISDQTGPTSFTGIYGKAAYAIPFSRDWLLSVGLTGGMVQYRIRGDELFFLESGDVDNGSLTKFFPDFGVGATLYFDEKYYLSFTIPQTFGLNLNFRENLNTVLTQRVRHYYATVGAFIPLNGNSWIEPSAEVRYVENVPILFSGRLRYEYQERFWIGLNASSAKALGIDAGIMWDVGYNGNAFKLGYAFTNFFQTYGPHFGMTHEIGLDYYW